MEPLLNPPSDGDDRNAPDLEPDNVPPNELIDRSTSSPGDDFPPTDAIDVPDDENESDTDLDYGLTDEIAEDDAEDDAEEIADPDHESAPPPEIDPAMTFADLKLNRAVIDALTQSKYTHPTPIQEAVIPPALRGKDVIGQAQTGTGKTAAFILPFLNRWRPHKLKGPIGLVMTPTRELALQVAKESEKLAPSRFFRTVPVYGGTGMVKQLQGLAKGCDLVVGTPGRMLDHLQRTYGLSRPDAYMLCSVMVDLKICEIVDAPHWVISAFLPQSIFAQ